MVTTSRVDGWVGSESVHWVLMAGYLKHNDKDFVIKLCGAGVVRVGGCGVVGAD